MPTMNVQRPGPILPFVPRCLRHALPLVAAAAAIVTVTRPTVARADGDLPGYPQLQAQLEAPQTPSSLPPLLTTFQPRRTPRGALRPVAEVVTAAATPSGVKTAAPRHGGRRAPAATFQGFTTTPGRYVIRGGAQPRTSAGETGTGRFLTFPNAEATGAAQGQTVNCAVNDLD